MKLLKIVLIFFFALSVNVHADEVFMAIVPTSTKYDALITIYGTKCKKPDGNVILASGKDFANGCWSLDGERVKVEWFDGNEPNYYNKNIFRLITNTEIQKR